MSKLALCIIFLLLGTILGTIIGVKIDTDIIVRGKIKQKTRRGQSNINDISSNLNINKKRRKNGKINTAFCNGCAER